MAGETGDPASAGKAPESHQQNAQENPQAKDQKPAKPDQQAKAGDAPAGGEKKLSNAELKKKAKEEKAARRAQAKAAQVAQLGSAGQQSQAGEAKSGGGGGGKGKSKQDALQHHQKPGQRVVPVAAKEVKPAIPERFSHLPVARRIKTTQADKDVHPSVLIVGQYMATFEMINPTERLETTLLAFKKVIESYTTPQGTTFSRHFTSHVLSPQIVYLAACRPMCFSMGNAIRWLKLQISKLDIDLADSEAAQVLCRAIDQFIETRSTMAEPIIAVKAVESFSPTEVILTYAHHRLVELALLLAQKCRYKIKVIVVDDPYERTGLNFAKRLSAKGFEHVTYSTDLGGLRTHLRSATRVLLGAEAIFSNGAMYARAGTCDIAVAAKEMNVPLTALCETINFTERVATDSLTYNEIDPERCTEEECRLLFDTTRPEYIDSIITELGWSTPASAAATLRKLEEL